VPESTKIGGRDYHQRPGTVWYRFLAGAVSHSPEGTVSFSEAGTKTVTTEGTIRATPRVPEAAMLAIMEDQQGNHGPLTLSSGDVDYNITCTGQATPAVEDSRPRGRCPHPGGSTEVRQRVTLRAGLTPR